MNDDSLKLIVLENINDLGQKVNEYIKKRRKTTDDYIVPIKQVRFSNGEGKIVLDASVRAKDVYILADVGNYNVSYTAYDQQRILTPDEHFQDIKRVISAIRGNAERITVIMPLLYESRQHSRNGRESLDCAIALQELERLGVHNIMTFDAHDPNVQNAIPLLSFDNFFPTNTILNCFIDENDLNYDNLLIVSPDEGAMKRSRYYASMLQCDIGMFYKRRDYSVIVEGKNPIIEHKYLGKEEEGIDYIIVDDMVASGGSIIDILEQLQYKNPHSVTLIATFALFTNGCKIFDDAYEKGMFTKFYSTNLSYIPEEIKNKPWFKAVDCSEFLADIIDISNKRKSISPLLNGKKEMANRIKEKKEKQN